MTQEGHAGTEAPDDIYVCAVCGRVLDAYALPGQPDRHVHSLQDQEAEDHPAVPVLRHEVPGRGRCDFCNADYPSWIVPARSFELPGIPGHMSNGDWAACQYCAPLVGRNEWTALVRRARLAHRARTGEDLDPMVLAALTMMYRKLRNNITGQPHKETA